MHQTFLILGARYMTSLARHFFVSPNQGEAAVDFVIKFLGKPIQRDMAGATINRQTVCRFAIHKLALMNIIVTGGAIFRPILEREFHQTRFTGGFVTSRASSRLMPVTQSKFSAVVIKFRRAPSVFLMTNHTSGHTSGINNFCRLAQMWIAMTVGALAIRRRQIHSLGVNRFGVDALGLQPRFLRLVALETRCGLVSATQWKRRFGVASQGVLGRTEARDRMAILARHEAFTF